MVPEPGAAAQGRGTGWFQRFTGGMGGKVAAGAGARLAHILGGQVPGTPALQSGSLVAMSLQHISLWSSAQGVPLSRCS